MGKIDFSKLETAVSLDRERQIEIAEEAGETIKEITRKFSELEIPEIVVDIDHETLEWSGKKILYSGCGFSREVLAGLPLRIRVSMSKYIHLLVEEAEKKYMGAM